MWMRLKFFGKSKIHFNVFPTKLTLGHHDRVDINERWKSPSLNPGALLLYHGTSTQKGAAVCEVQRVLAFVERCC